MAACDHAGAHLWERTDLKPGDVDVAELYDGFSFLDDDWLEALGFCGKGESGPFIEGGHRIAQDGDLPLNTHGQPVGRPAPRSGFIHEAWPTGGGAAGERQVTHKPVEIAAVGNGGGPIAGGAAPVEAGRADALPGPSLRSPRPAGCLRRRGEADRLRPGCERCWTGS